jgi:hypothetical protein
MRELPEYVRRIQMGEMPMVNYSGSMAQAESLGRASDALGKMATDMYDRDVEIQKISAKAQMDATLNEQFLQAGNDPAALREMQTKYKAGFVKGIKSPRLAEEFSAVYDANASALLSKATSNRMQIQAQEHEVALLSAIDNAIESGAQYVDNVFSEIPEHVMGAEVALGTNAVAFDNLISARNQDGSFMFTPAQQVSFKRRLEDGIQARAEKAQAIAIAEQNLKMTDYAAWAESKGMSVDQIAMAQENQPYIDVIGSGKAKQYAEAIKGAQNIDEFAQMAMQIKGEFKQYAPNALAKIARNLPADKASALNLALSDDANNYSEQIAALNLIAPLKDSALDEEYKATTAEPVIDIETAVYSSPEVIQNAAAMREEGDAQEAMPYLTQTVRLAKAYRIKNPSASTDDAIKFANAHTMDKYRFNKMNGVTYRLPTKLPNGRPLDQGEADTIDGYIKDNINKLDFQAIDRNVVRRDNVVPVLNPTRDGLLFKADDKFLFDSAGKPAEVKFVDALQASQAEAQQTVDLKRKRQLFRRRSSGMNAQQTEQLRREMFPEAFE